MKLVAAVLIAVLTLGCSLSARFEQKPSNELRFTISSAHLDPDGRFCIVTTKQQVYCVNSLRDENGEHRVFIRIDESIVGTTAVITPSDIYASRIIIFVTSQEAYKEYQSQIDTVDTQLYKPRKDAPLTVSSDWRN